jgi:hypothetical protein
MTSVVHRVAGLCLAVSCVALGVAVPIASGSVPAGAAVPLGVRPAPAPTPAQAGASWLGNQFTAAGFIKSNGAPDPGSTAEAVLAFAAAGVGGAKAKAGLRWLEKHFESYVSQGGVDDAGSLATVILAAQSMGVDPTRFGGSAPADNLVARLEATQRTTGSDTGLFGASDPTYDGAFRQGLALMALANQGISNAAGVAWLQGQQCSDGGWEAYRSDTTQPCPAPDPNTFAGPDTNSSALAVEGLVATGSSFPISPTPFFESAQNTDGGFGFIGASSQEPDADSTGDVIQALVALSQLDNPAFTQAGGATPISALDAFQVGCPTAKKNRGAFAFQPSNGELTPNLLATLQAVPAAAQVAFPLSAQHPAKGLPTLTCPGR